MLLLHTLCRIIGLDGGLAIYHGEARELLDSIALTRNTERGSLAESSEPVLIGLGDRA